MEKELNKTPEKKLANEQCAQECLQNDTESVSIQILNDDCLIYIFQLLPLRDKVRIERVCTRWRILSQNSWHKMKTLDLSSFTWGFRECQIPVDIFYNILQKYGKFLKRLILSSCQHNKLYPFTLTLSSFIKFCPNLEEIDVSAINIFTPDIQELAKNFTNITKLYLGFSRCCDEDWQDFFKANSKLKYFKIELNHLNKSLLYLPEHMHSLNFLQCTFKDNYLPLGLMRLKNLRSLTIQCCYKVPEHTIEIVCIHCKNLTVLNLMYYDPPFHRVTSLNLPNLQVLVIRNNHKISDEFLANLVLHCQQLTSIEISHCPAVTDTGLAALAALLKLEKLNIDNMYKITGYGLRNICGLKELHCYNCLQITDHNISLLIKLSPQLQLLNIVGCENITAFTIRAAKKAFDSRFNNMGLRILLGCNLNLCEFSNLSEIIF